VKLPNTSDFQEFHAKHPDTQWQPGRSLAVVTREEALRTPGNLVWMLFQYGEPALGFQPSEHQLLNAALAGLTDEALANKLGIRQPAVKKRWRSIFARVSARPDLFPESRDGLDDGSRGRQTRHYILAYVREHPEELRPFERKDQHREQSPQNSA
jgi:DNA-binding CsgD family transcriptional regulator